MGKTNSSQAFAAFQTVMNEMARAGTVRIPGLRAAQIGVNRQAKSRKRNNAKTNKGVFSLANLFGTRGAMVNPLQNIEGSAIYLDYIDESFTIAADKKLRTQGMLEFKTWFDLFNTQENAEPALKTFITQLVVRSEDPFILVPFMCTLETAGVITSSNEASSDYMAAIEAAIAGTEGSYEVLGEIIAKINPNKYSNAYSYTANVDLNLTSRVQRYFSHCSKKEFDGESPKAYYFGLAVRGEPETVVNVDGWNRIVCSQKKRKPVLL
jgi:rubrerythrin